MKVLEQQNPATASLIPYEPGKPIEDVARELGLDPNEIIKLASNESALGVSPKAIEAMKNAAEEMFLYPDGGGFGLRSKLAERFGVDFSQIILGNGSNEILEFIGHVFMRPEKSVVFSDYSFVVYRLMAKMFGAEAISVPTSENFTHDLNGIADAIREDTSVVFICNPNNPTGSMVGEAEVAEFMSKVPDHVLVVFDEAYAEICLGEMPDTMKYVKDNRNCIVLRTFSKAYGLAGLRIGYGIGPAPIVEAIQKPRQPFNTNRMAQIAAIAALDDEFFVRKSRQLYLDGKHFVEKACQERGIEFVPAFANFILIKTGTGRDISNALQENGVIVRPMDGYGLPDWIRITFGTSEQNHHFIETLDKVLSAFATI